MSISLSAKQAAEDIEATVILNHITREGLEELLQTFLDSELAASKATIEEQAQRIANLEYSNEEHRKTAENWRGAACEREALRATIAELRETGCAGISYTHVDNVSTLRTQLAAADKDKDANLRLAVLRCSERNEAQTLVAARSKRLLVVEYERDALVARMTIVEKERDEALKEREEIVDHWSKNYYKVKSEHAAALAAAENDRNEARRLFEKAEAEILTCPIVDVTSERDTLRAQLTAAEKERDELKRRLGEGPARIQTTERERDAALAALEEAKKELQPILDYHEETGKANASIPGLPYGPCYCRVCIAFAALKQKGAAE